MKKILMAAIVLLTATMLTGCMCLHKWEEATCAEPKTCSRCGATEGKTLAHDWVEADCEKPKTCEECGAAEGEALGHTVVEWETISDSTMHGDCSVCKDKVEQEIDHEILGIQKILGRWEMIAALPNGSGDDWQGVEDNWGWIEFHSDGKAEYKIGGEYGEGTYQFVFHPKDTDTNCFFVQFDDGFCELRLYDFGQLQWFAENIRFCYERN